MRPFLIALILLALAGPALAAKRVALVIGNSAYKHTPELNNTKNDATDMEAAFKALGFEVVKGIDLDKREMERTIRRFSRKLQKAAVGAFFYAGHGIQVSGVNYLVPTDAQLSTSDALDFEMIRLDVVQRGMENAARTNVIFLDACRDNPLSRNLARALGTRSTSIGRGLAQVEAGLGTLISYATQPGNVALDGNTRNSPYTAALKQHIGLPGEELTTILIRVRNDVIEATSGKQIPWDQSALRSRLFLGEKPSLSYRERLTRVVQRSNSVVELDAYRRLEPSLASLIDRRKKVLAEISRKKRLAAAHHQRAGRKNSDEETVVALLKRAPGVDTSSTSSTCDGVEVSLASGGKVCIKPGSGKSFKDCPTCPEMVVVPAGSFMMGSNNGDANEKPVRKVTIARPFAVGKFEITFDEWDACVSEGYCKHKPSDQHWGRGKRPVINVSWYDITKQYLPWLSRKSGKNYRLLSEAEWEYVARARTTTAYHWGDKFASSKANNGSKTVPVGHYPPNAFGVYDLHGNVWEWVQDCYKDSYRGAPRNGSAVTTGKCDRRVFRGGSWGYVPRFLRSAGRVGTYHDYRDDNNGFRVERMLIP
jgi:formylglycine-generating enzyme required for sulfatase activity